MKRRFELEPVETARHETKKLRRREPTAMERIEALCDRLNPGLTALALALAITCTVMTAHRLAQVMELPDLDGFVVTAESLESP